MRKITTVFIFLFLFLLTFSQSPEKMSYQSVVRNNLGELIVNSNISLQINILQYSANGVSVYGEIHHPTTNANGLVSVAIGEGTLLYGNLSAINWSDGPYFIKTEIDPLGGSHFQIEGTSQLLSVPYALHAKSADSCNGNFSELDPIFTAWDKSTGILITESQIIDLGNYLTTESQNLDDVLTIDNSAGNKNITNLADPVNAQDAVTKLYVDTLISRIELLELLLFGFIDSRDGNHYRVVKIGNQIWMAENLAYLPSVVPSSMGSSSIPYYYVYNFSGTDVNSAKQTDYYCNYGVLYNWSAAMSGFLSSHANPSGVRGICPEGWHLPSHAEWNQLTSFLGGSNIAGGKLKEQGTEHWNSPNTCASNKTGFTALPGGYKEANSSFSYLGRYGFWWSATQYSDNEAYYRGLNYDNAEIGYREYQKEYGFSVRCVKD